MEDRIYQMYYQWVIVVLLLQASIFYLPAYFWKIYEHGRLSKLCKQLATIPLPENEYLAKKEYLIKYLLSDNREVHTVYALRFFVCEIANFIVLVSFLFISLIL